MPHRRKIAIIGAGLTGLHLARRLGDLSSVTVFEKSRGFGGRMSVRRTQGHHFDHGAQYFTARGDAFRRFLAPFIAEGVVAEWRPRLAGLAGAPTPVWSTPRHVAVPGMNALAKRMAAGCDVRLGVRVGRIVRRDGLWALESVEGEDLGRFDLVISTAPAEQSAALMPGEFSAMDSLAAARMQGCFSLMLGYETLPDPGWDAGPVGSGPLAWVAMNDSKPGRPAARSLLCQSRNDWAEAHLEEDQDSVRATLHAAAAELLGPAAPRPQVVALHRWRYALVETAAGRPFLLDADAGLAAAGDWCGAGRIEAAFDSAEALADALEDRV